MRVEQQARYFPAGGPAGSFRPFKFWLYMLQRKMIVAGIVAVLTSGMRHLQSRTSRGMVAYLCCSRQPGLQCEGADVRHRCIVGISGITSIDYLILNTPIPLYK